MDAEKVANEFLNKIPEALVYPLRETLPVEIAAHDYALFGTAASSKPVIIGLDGNSLTIYEVAADDGLEIHSYGPVSGASLTKRQSVREGGKLYITAYVLHLPSLDPGGLRTVDLGWVDHDGAAEIKNRLSPILGRAEPT